MIAQLYSNYKLSITFFYIYLLHKNETWKNEKNKMYPKLKIKARLQKQSLTGRWESGEMADLFTKYMHMFDMGMKCRKESTQNSNKWSH